MENFLHTRQFSQNNTFNDYNITNDGAAYEDDYQATENLIDLGNENRTLTRRENRNKNSTETHKEPNKETNMEETFQKMAEIMIRTFQNTRTDNVPQSTQAPLSRRIIPYTYAGEDYEDPVWFIEKISILLEEANIHDELEKIHYTAEQLKGKARTWYQANIRLIQDFNELVHLFLEQYNNFNEICRIKRRLQGEQQPTHESAVAFITRKRRMCERVMPDTPFYEISLMIIDQLEPQLGMHVSARNYENFNDLMRWAKYYEERLKIVTQNSVTNRYRQTNTNYGNNTTYNSNATQAAGTVNKTPPSQCKYCKEWHFHRDCPKNPYKSGNDNRAEKTVRNPTSAQTQQTASNQTQQTSQTTQQRAQNTHNTRQYNNTRNQPRQTQ